MELTKVKNILAGGLYLAPWSIQSYKQAQHILHLTMNNFVYVFFCLQVTWWFVALTIIGNLRTSLGQTAKSTIFNFASIFLLSFRSTVRYFRMTHFLLMYIWLLPIFANFHRALKGPGYVPLGWKPVRTTCVFVFGGCGWGNMFQAGTSVYLIPSGCLR